MPSIASCSPTNSALPGRSLVRAREGTAGRLKNPARSTCPRTSTLRISLHGPWRGRRAGVKMGVGLPVDADASLGV